MAQGYKFRIKKATNGQFYWIFQAPNGEIMAISETMHNYSDILHAINVIKEQASAAMVIQ